MDDTLLLNRLPISDGENDWVWLEVATEQAEARRGRHSGTRGVSWPRRVVVWVPSRTVMVATACVLLVGTGAAQSALRFGAAESEALPRRPSV